MAHFETINLENDLCALCHQEVEGETLISCSRCSRSQSTDPSDAIHTEIKAHEECLDRDHQIYRQANLTSPKVKKKTTRSLSPNIFALLTLDSPRSSAESSPCGSHPNSPRLARILTDRVNKGRKQTKTAPTQGTDLDWFGFNEGTTESHNDISGETKERPRAKSPFSEIEPRYFWSPKQDGAALYVLRKLKERRGQDTCEEDRALQVVEEARDYDSSKFLSVTLDGSRSYFSLSPLAIRRCSGAGAFMVPKGNAPKCREPGEALTHSRPEGDPPEGTTNYSSSPTNISPQSYQHPNRADGGECRATTTRIQVGECQREIPSIYVRRASSDTSIDKLADGRNLSKRVEQFWRENKRDPEGVGQTGNGS